MIGVKTQSKEADPRVGNALRQLEINYEIDKDGDYRFGFNLPDGRSQMGFIRSATYDFAGAEMRDVFSIGLDSFGPFDARTANFLLETNAQAKIGSWALARDGEDNHMAVFRAPISADLSGELLNGVILAVLMTADSIEERLSGRDDF